MNGTNSIFDMFDSISKSLFKTFDGFNEIKNNMIKDYVGEGIHNEVTFKYDTKLEPEDKKKIIIDKLNCWSRLARIFGKDTVVKFEFAEDEIFYFTWDDDYKAFVTEDPNGVRFIYSVKDETLINIVEDDKNDENVEPKKEAAGIRTEVVDNTAIEDDESIEKNFNLKDDKNLAANLRNALRDSLAEFKNNKDEKQCKEIFCPFEASENFKRDVIDNAVYETDFDNDGNPVQIRFDISWLIPEYDKCDEYPYCIAINDIYHNESANLDEFCELIKEKYNFSLGSWNIKFDNDRNVEAIEFIFTF